MTPRLEDGPCGGGRKNVPDASGDDSVDTIESDIEVESYSEAELFWMLLSLSHLRVKL